MAQMSQAFAEALHMAVQDAVCEVLVTVAPEHEEGYRVDQATWHSAMYAENDDGEAYLQVRVKQGCSVTSGPFAVRKRERQ